MDLCQYVSRWIPEWDSRGTWKYAVRAEPDRNPVLFCGGADSVLCLIFKRDRYGKRKSETADTGMDSGCELWNIQRDPYGMAWIFICVDSG